ncbi:uncharacterized protein HD556DRAFT_1241038, partial [Suillus plorans]
QPVLQRTCRQNGRHMNVPAQWTHGKDMATTSNATADGLISSMAASHTDSRMYNDERWIESISSQVVEARNSLNNSLQSVVRRCRVLSAKEVGGNFLLMINQIQLLVETQR